MSGDNRRKHFRMAGLAALMIFMTLAGGALAQGPVKVAIVPFTMNAEKDMGFLQQGILDMLATRLAWEGEVAVMESQKVLQETQKLKGPLTQETAKSLGAKLGADFVLFGSLTVFGESISLDATMMDVSGQRPPITVFDQTRGMDALIPKVNDFAQNINARIFGRAVETAAPAVRPAPAVPSTYAHPDSLIPGLTGVGDELQEGQAVGSSPFIMTGAGSAAEFWKSPNYELEMQGLALGDIDADGKLETIFIAGHTVFVKRVEQGRLVSVAEYKGEAQHKYIWVDAADINGNGPAEIFVSCVNGQSERVESFVLEYNGSSLEPIVQKQRWFFTVVSTPGQEPTLYGQRGGTSAPLLPGVFQMDYEAGEYVEGLKQPLPEYVQAFGFNFASLADGEPAQPIGYDASDNLKVFSVRGKKEWSSDEAYGGSHKFLRLGGEDKDSAGRVYLNQRILVTDLNGDGRPEIIVNQNKGSIGKLFQRYRRYTSGSLASLVWDGLGLAPVWHTRKLSGYMADIAVGDFDNDGQPELISAMVQGGSILGGKDKSSLIAYELGKLEPAR